jgi:hypothetical protein
VVYKTVTSDVKMNIDVTDGVSGDDLKADTAFTGPLKEGIILYTGASKGGYYISHSHL